MVIDSMFIVFGKNWRIYDFGQWNLTALESIKTPLHSVGIVSGIFKK